MNNACCANEYNSGYNFFLGYKYKEHIMKMSSCHFFEYFFFGYHSHNSFNQPSILQFGSALNLTKSCSNICSGEGLFSGSLIKQVSTKFWHSGERSAPTFGMG